MCALLITTYKGPLVWFYPVTSTAFAALPGLFIYMKKRRGVLFPPQALTFHIDIWESREPSEQTQCKSLHANN